MVKSSSSKHQVMSYHNHGDTTTLRNHHDGTFTACNLCHGTASHNGGSNLSFSSQTRHQPSYRDVTIGRNHQTNTCTTNNLCQGTVSSHNGGANLSFSAQIRLQHPHLTSKQVRNFVRHAKQRRARQRLTRDRLDVMSACTITSHQ
jgi:hypothetical protein